MADYDGFISYSHAQDKPVAAALQTAVQRLGKPWYRRRALRIFRDDTSLSATPHLWPSIEQALARSRYLILLVSPQAAASPWVGKEVEYWLAHKSIDTFLLAVTDGEVGWEDKAGDFLWSAATPLPLALKGQFPAEPKWVDLRKYRGGASARDGKFIDLAADLAAAIHGTPKEDLLSQEVRQQRRALMLAWSAAASLLVLTAAAGWEWQVARTQRAKAESALTAATGTADRLVFDLALELRNQPSMPVSLVLDILRRAVAMQGQLTAAGDSTPDLRRLEAAALGELSTTLIDQGAAGSARSAAERGLVIMDGLVKLDPANAEYQRDLAIVLNKLGDARVAQSDYPSALGFFQRAYALNEKLADAAPDKGQLQDDLAARPGQDRFHSGGDGQATGSARYIPALSRSFGKACRKTSRQSVVAIWFVPGGKPPWPGLDGNGAKRSGAPGLSIRPRYPSKARRRRTGQHRTPARAIRQLHPNRRRVCQNRSAAGSARRLSECACSHPETRCHRSQQHPMAERAFVRIRPCRRHVGGRRGERGIG